jgi:hypothetical protein
MWYFLDGPIICRTIDRLEGDYDSWYSYIVIPQMNEKQALINIIKA